MVDILYQTMPIIHQNQNGPVKPLKQKHLPLFVVTEIMI